MDRRGLLRLLVGGAAAGATGGVSVSAAAAAIGVNAATATVEQIGESCSGPMESPVPWRVMNMLRVHRHAKSRPVDQMPPHIAGKRSWSPVYKAGLLAREEAILEAFYQRMEAEEGFAARFFNAILGESQ